MGAQRAVGSEGRLGGGAAGQPAGVVVTFARRIQGARQGRARGSCIRGARRLCRHQASHVPDLESGEWGLARGDAMLVEDNAAW